MSEAQNSESNVKGTIDAVTGLVQAVPIYNDALQPAAKELGKSLEIIAKTVNILLSPLKTTIWGYEKIEEFINKRVSEKLVNTCSEDIISPPINIAGPVVEAMRFTGDDYHIRELYANLLANSMDRSTVINAHPGFVEIIKSICADEAKLLKVFIEWHQYSLLDVYLNKSSGGFEIYKKNHTNFHKSANLNFPDLTPSYIDNLCRLGILEIPTGIHSKNRDIYDSLKNDFNREEILNNHPSFREISFEEMIVRTTVYGSQFINSVVKEK